MAEEVTKVVENVDKLFSEIVVNGESHVSDRYVPPEPAEANPPVEQEEETSQQATPQEDVQGEYVDTLYLNSIRHDLKDSPLTQEVSAIQQAINILQGRLNDLVASVGNINSKIPVQASAQNQLADKNFVNSSIATNTANFLGTYSTLAEIEAIPDPTNNDYAFLETADGAGNNVYDRYKYSAEDEEWLFEYELNNSSFTAEQWATINSGITQVTDVVQSGNYNPVTSDAVRDAIDNSGSGIKVFDTEQEIIDDLPNLHPLDIVAYKASKDPKSGVPLGTWASFENDSAPNGEWLQGGTTFDPNTYPALAMMLGGNRVPQRYTGFATIQTIGTRYNSCNFEVSGSTPYTLLPFTIQNASKVKFVNGYGYQRVDLGASFTCNVDLVNATTVYVGGANDSMSWGSTLTGTYNANNDTWTCTAMSGSNSYVQCLQFIGGDDIKPLFIKATPTSSDSDYEGTLNSIRTYVENKFGWRKIADRTGSSSNWTTPVEIPSSATEVMINGQNNADWDSTTDGMNSLIIIPTAILTETAKPYTPNETASWGYSSCTIRVKLSKTQILWAYTTNNSGPTNRKVSIWYR